MGNGSSNELGFFPCKACSVQSVMTAMGGLQKLLCCNCYPCSQGVSAAASQCTVQSHFLCSY